MRNMRPVSRPDLTFGARVPLAKSSAQNVQFVANSGPWDRFCRNSIFDAALAHSIGCFSLTRPIFRSASSKPHFSQKVKPMSMKDIPRGSGSNCEVLGEGNTPADHRHASRTTPLQTKKRELENDPQYQAEAIDTTRAKRTTALRRAKDVRPL